MNNFSISLGFKVKDKITGYQGVVIARAEHLNGCNRYGVQGPVDKDGKIPDPYWFDEMQLEIIWTDETFLQKLSPDRGGPTTKMEKYKWDGEL